MDKKYIYKPIMRNCLCNLGYVLPLVSIIRKKKGYTSHLIRKLVNFIKLCYF